MLCYRCGLACPVGCRRCPSCGAKITGPQPFLPLRGLGNLVVTLLALVIAVVLVRMILQAAGADYWPEPGDLSLAGLDTLGDGLSFLTGILFVIWLRRARINAECFMRQRRARGWAFWGWIIPIVNFWIPFQIIGDIWRAGLPPDQRRRTAWLPVTWWTSWLLGGLTVEPASQRTRRPAISDGVHLMATTWMPCLGCLAIAGATLIAIIYRVSAGPVGSPHWNDDSVATDLTAPGIP